MMGDDIKKMTEEETNLRLKELDLRTRYDRFLQSDRAAADIGIGALKTVILINAGAIVSLLALIGQLWNNQDQGRQLAIQIIPKFLLFGWGLAAGGVAFTVAYFYQSAITELARKDFDGVFSVSVKPPSMLRLANITRIMMVAFAFISLVFFIFGMFGVASALQSPLPDKGSHRTVNPPIIQPASPNILMKKN